MTTDLGRTAVTSWLRRIRNHEDLVTIDLNPEVDELLIGQTLGNIVGHGNASDVACPFDVGGDVDYLRELNFVNISNDLTRMQPNPQPEGVREFVNVFIE